MAHPNTGHPILMDAYEDRNKGLPHYIRHVKQHWQPQYTFHWHFGPHDLKKTEYTSNNQQQPDRGHRLRLGHQLRGTPQA